MKYSHFYQSVFIRIFSFVVLFLLLNGGLWGETAVFAANPIPVDCTNGVGSVGSLATAIEQANNQDGHDTISLGRDCSYRLTSRREGLSGLPYIRDSLTIEGNGATIYRKPIKTNVIFRLFEVEPRQGTILVYLKNLTLADGAVNGDGGAFYAKSEHPAERVELQLEGVTLQNNAASRHGGAIYLEGPGNARVSYSQLIGNKAGGNGGGFWTEQPAEFVNTHFWQNEAKEGGGIASTAEVIVRGGSFEQNIGAYQGGGIYKLGITPITISGSQFIRNKSHGDGGAMYIATTQTSIVNTRFEHNVAIYSGGAIYHLGRLNLEKSQFYANESALAGALHLIVRQEEEAYISNNLWVRNQGAEDVTAIVIDGTPKIKVAFNTFVGNANEVDSAAISIAHDRIVLAILSNIITNYRVGIRDANKGSIVYNSLYFDTVINETNVYSSQYTIEGDPLFVDAENDNYRLQEGSPAIDRGFSFKDDRYNDDINNILRPLGNGHDIGAFESDYQGNTGPQAEQDFYVGEQGKRIIVEQSHSVLKNDLDEEGDELEVFVYQGPLHGTVDLETDGSFEYVPVSDFSGSDRFVYIAFDGSLLSEPTEVSIIVTQQAAVEDQYESVQDTPLIVDANQGVLINDIEIEGIAARLQQDVKHGTLSLNADGSFTYVPEIGFFGDDHFLYYVDGLNSGKSDPTVVTIHVHEQPNELPMAVDNAYSVDENETLNIAASNGVLANDSDGDGDELEAHLVELPEFGDLDLDADGSFRYTPNANFFGEDSFTYQADDGKERSETATVRITVNEVNSRPTAVDDSYSLAQDQFLVVSTADGVLSNDSDVDGDSLRTRFVSGTSHGTFGLSNDGSFTYEPNEGFFGTDSFQYQADDGRERSNVATVTITVERINGQPTAADDAYQLQQGEVLTIAPNGVLANDSDAEGDALTAELVSSPENGTLILNSDGSLIYEPVLGFFGNDSFRYLAHDGELPSAPAIVTITVTPPSSPVEPVPYQLFLPIVVRSN